MHERARALKVGDQAPDFSLPKLDKSETIDLKALNRLKPVVLVFSSYT
jgi:peroxiredoxin